MSGIAEAIGKPTSTISRMIGRTSVPTPETVGQVAQLLRVEPEEIWRLLGRGGREGLGRWNPPEAAHDFDGETRDVLNRLIRVLAKGEQGWVAPAAEDNDPPGAGDNVRHLADMNHTQGDVVVDLPERRAARRIAPTSKRRDAHLNKLGEETQDPEKP